MVIFHFNNSGPVGVGKSYLLYLLAAEYRLNRQKLFRVTYINDCASWRIDKIGYFLRELVATFFNDTIQSKSIVEWCETLSGNRSEWEEKMISIMDTLINYVKDNNLQWIVICDQHNALYSHSVVVKDFPFNLIDFFSKKRGSNIRVVISASANNEGYPTEMKGWLTHDISSHRFDNDEFNVWCNQYWLSTGKVDSDSDEAIDALFWTGGVPYELYLLWKQPKPTLLEKTRSYRENRVKEMAATHSKFIGRLSEQEKANLMECISRMHLGLSPPEIEVGMDRQLFDIDKDESGSTIITALNPVARHALLAFHRKLLTNSLTVVADIVFEDGGFTNDTKGRIIEKYILTQMEISNHFKFKSYKTTSKGLSTVEPVTKVLKIKDIIQFSGNKLPLRSSFNKRVVTLFIPISPTYPGLDFFIWNPDAEQLMAFQVTIVNPFTRHPKIDVASVNSDLWVNFCSDGMEVKNPLELYWIIPNICVGKPVKVIGRVVLFEDLCDDFPALQKLNLK